MSLSCISRPVQLERKTQTVEYLQPDTVTDRSKVTALGHHNMTDMATGTGSTKLYARDRTTGFNII